MKSPCALFVKADAVGPQCWKPNKAQSVMALAFHQWSDSNTFSWAPHGLTESSQSGLGSTQRGAELFRAKTSFHSRLRGAAVMRHARAAADLRRNASRQRRECHQDRASDARMGSVEQDCKNAPNRDPTFSSYHRADFRAKTGVFRGVTIGADRDPSPIQESSSREDGHGQSCEYQRHHGHSRTLE